MKLNPLIRIRDASTISIARAVIAAVTFLAGALLAALPATAQVLQGEPGAPSTREFPDSRVLPTPTPPFAGDIQPNHALFREN